MTKFVRVVKRLLLLAVIAHGVAACSTAEHPPSVPLEPIPVMDLNSVAGDWEGIMVQVPASRYDDWVQLHIQEDGTYHFEAFRTIGVFSGHGRFAVEDGMLSARSEKGTISLQLHRHSGKEDRILKAKGRSIDGVTYFAELTPKRRPNSEQGNN